MRLAALELAARGLPEPLGRTSIGLQFRHFDFRFSVALAPEP